MPIVVQVEKEAEGQKGAVLTTNLSLAGRYLVFTPFDETRGVSRKVEDEATRARLRQAIRGLDAIEFPDTVADRIGEMRALFVDLQALFASVADDPSLDVWDEFIEKAGAYGVIADEVRRDVRDPLDVMPERDDVRGAAEVERDRRMDDGARRAEIRLHGPQSRDLELAPSIGRSRCFSRHGPHPPECHAAGASRCRRPT